MNKVMLTGRLVKDVELNNYGKGKNAGVWCRFTLAVNDGKDSEGEAKTQFIDCKAFGKTAELLEQFVKKGHVTLITGKIVNESWEDDDKERHFAQRVIADSVELLPNRAEEPKEGKKSYR